jgi:[ribosomal protein S5]-alanine N-acetyltransferase
MSVAIPPTMETSRLRLRRPLPTDANAIFEYASDREVTHYMDWPRCTSAQAVVDYLANAEAAWLSGEEFVWVVTLPNVDRAIGGTALRLRGYAADFGYVLNREYWGNGLGTEAALAIVSLALSIPGVRRIWATCDAQNMASVRLLEKCGLSREGVLRSHSVRPQISAEPRDALIYARVQ